MKLTKSQQNGLKFEIWLEKHLSGPQYWSINRNVNFIKAQYELRQVDLVLRDYNPLNSLVIVEAKYRTMPIRLKLSKKKRAQKRSIGNIIEELEERRLFTKARKGILVTNKKFEANVYQEANLHQNIELYDVEDLKQLSAGFHLTKNNYFNNANFLDKIPFYNNSNHTISGKKQTIDEQIHAINLKKHFNKPTQQYVDGFMIRQLFLGETYEK